jgi:hypothetical protein
VTKAQEILETDWWHICLRFPTDMEFYASVHTALLYIIAGVEFINTFAYSIKMPQESVRIIQHGI